LSPTVLVWGTTPEEMDTRVSVVTEALFQQGLVIGGPETSRFLCLPICKVFWV
jgi:hypothetical protein